MISIVIPVFNEKESLAILHGEIDRALQLNPSSADIIAISAAAMSYFGNAEEGAAMCDRAFRLNSSPPNWYSANCVQNYFFTKRYQDSVNMSKRWMTYMPKGIWAYNFAWLTAAQSELGAAEDAAATIAEWKHVYPDLGADIFAPFFNNISIMLGSLYITA